MTVVWTHTTATGNANGVAWILATTGVDSSDAITAGGYVCIHTTGSDSETDGTSAQGLFPFVAAVPSHDTDHARWDMRLGFAVPHGESVEAHVWVTHS